MAVFVRTEEGQEAAYSPHSALPRKLKSILKVIDGRTPIDTFEKNLSSFGDVRAILQSLDMAGLIKKIESAAPFAPQSTAEFDELLSKPRKPVAPAASASTSTFVADDWAATRSANSIPASVPGMSAWQASELATQAMTAARLQHSPVLQEVLDSMANFVLTHLPEQSFQILKEIEEITSLELLAVTLGGYEQMVASVGESSVLHLNSIKQTLRNNL